MIRWKPLYAVASAELRQSRRLARYWVFASLALLVGMVGYIYYAFLHGLFSTQSATIAAIGPRFLVGAFGFNYMIVMMVGVVFLGFDVRARDQRERMAEVLDVRPYSNLELVLGRFLGLLIAVWVPVVFLLALLQGGGWLLRALDAPIGEPMELLSVVGLGTFSAIPCFALVLALVFLVTLLVRHRLVAAVVLLALLGADVFATVRLPLSLNPLVDLTGGYAVLFPSEMLPGVAGPGGWVQRLGLLVLALGMLMLAAAVHPRRDGGRRDISAAGGVALLVCGLACVGYVANIRVQGLALSEQWRAAHAERVEADIPDVLSISGTVGVEPGERLDMSLEMRLAAPVDADLETLLFSLNPGLSVQASSIGTGTGLDLVHQNGLLEISVPGGLPAGQEMAIRLEIQGRPDVWFGYLDSTLTPEALNALNAQLFLLGNERGIFDDRMVALMPGIRWLPTAGPDVGRDDLRRHGRDYLEVDLEVTVPEGWLVAGPGRRRDNGAEDGRASFRFAPAAPVDEVCLVASRFTSLAAEIDGVTMEVLLHPDHTRNLEILEAASDEVTTWVEERLQAARAIGLGYPYEAFTIVEVPSRLRCFSGGWRMDTTLAQPSMALLREISLPSARFDLAFDDPTEFDDVEGGMPAVMKERLRRFFVNDFTGGNIFASAARSFFLHQTSARGPEGLALTFVLEDLTTQIITDNQAYFSAHMFTPELGQAVGQALQSYFRSGRGDGNVASAVIEVFANRPEVWDSVLETSLADLDPLEDPRRTLDALTLKGGALARAVADTLGSTGAGELLAKLRAAHSGETFTLEDVVAADADGTGELGRLLEDWLTTTDLPGFIVSDAEAFRIADAADGSPQYQLLATVGNPENVPGFLRLAYQSGVGDELSSGESDPIRLDAMSAVRYGVVLSQAPVRLSVEPYLSLNRGAFLATLNEVDAEQIADTIAFNGVEQAELVADDGETILVDDLDPGFTTVAESRQEGVRLSAKVVESDTDAGLPAVLLRRPTHEWARGSDATAWGRYRHTYVCVRSGQGDKEARFSAEIPRSSRWDLEVHLPSRGVLSRFTDWGIWKLRVTDLSGTTDVELDTSAAARGWNLVGSYELAAGKVDVVLSNETEGDVVVADAIRWNPSAGGDQS